MKLSLINTATVTTTGMEVLFGSCESEDILILHGSKLRGLNMDANESKIIGINRLLDDLRVTAAQVYVTAAKLNYYYSKIKTAERVSTVRERIKTEENDKIV
ncbi:hypothetical protein Tco_1175648 [Tanacetum coccineum]